LVITIASLIAIGFATLMPEPQVATESHFCLVCGPLGGVSAILNVFLFVPLGIGLYLAGFPTKRALLGICALSALIEAAQFLVISGRNATIGDVATNSLGGALGFAIGHYALILLRPSPRIALALSVAWAAVWLAFQTLSGFGFAPAIPKSEYFGQIAPSLGDFEPFRGSVVRASIGDAVVSNARFPDSPRMRALLVVGATVTATVVPAGATGDIAPIVRVADAREREIVLIAQDARDFVFAVRTGAAVLRLRPPFFAVRDVFPAERSRDDRAVADALTMSARYSAREVWLNTQSSTSHDRRIPISASLGWTLLLPVEWFIEGTRFELVASWIWIACLLLPLGYWGGRFALSLPTRSAATIRMIGVPIALALIFVGLVAIPKAFGLAEATISDWLAASTGILLGLALARRAIVAA
jgi:hypothetical protein